MGIIKDKANLFIELTHKMTPWQRRATTVAVLFVFTVIVSTMIGLWAIMSVNSGEPINIIEFFKKIF